jgi:hypothetical protein
LNLYFAVGLHHRHGAAPDPGCRLLEQRAPHIVKHPIELRGPGPLYPRHECFLFSVFCFLFSVESPGSRRHVYFSFNL